MTVDKDGYQYSYDYENRLIEVLDPCDNSVAEYDYDALGRKIEKYDAAAAETTYYYYNPDWQVFQLLSDSTQSKNESKLALWRIRDIGT